MYIFEYSFQHWTQAYEYMPYSQRVQIRDLPYTGGANGWPGRHIFRIDEKILPGVCIRDLSKVSSISDN